MKIAIVTAMPEESAAVLKGALNRRKSSLGGRKRYQCTIAGHEIELIETGMGLLNGGWGATLLAAECPDLIISAGFAGGVLPGLSVGEVVMAEQVLHLFGDRFEEVAVGFYGRNSAADTLGIPRATFISCESVVSKGRVAGLVPTGTSNPVVEMESAAIARVAAAGGIPFLGIRSVSDPWDLELGFSLEEFCDDQMRVRPLKVLATIFKRPRIIPQLICLARNSRSAASSLARDVQRLVQNI